MPRFSIAVLTLFLALPLCADDAPVATILCYHEVHGADEPMHGTIPRRTATGDALTEQLRYTATREQFREELDYLEQHDYNVIALDELVDFLRGRRPSLPPRAVVITVDDGWLSAYTEINPELSRRKMPWTLFVYPQFVGHGEAALTWPQVAELAAAGVDVESHTDSHSFLTLASNRNVSAISYPDFLSHELAGSKQTIEQKLHKPVRFLSYPYGDFDLFVQTAAQFDGYEAAVTTRRAPITRATPPLALTRYLIHHDTTIEEFKSWLP